MEYVQKAALYYISRRVWNMNLCVQEILPCKQNLSQGVLMKVGRNRAVKPEGRGSDVWLLFGILEVHLEIVESSPYVGIAEYFELGA
ncbi:hypothetical protein MPSYJ_00570 [Mycolicibacterium psychrotolerans]|uniref:Uncharacterized protein n=1 Tax=Mycolicibacterium psychrotolerans TaxID=216929 RepID=A0A7I7M3V6_9MYCO|nr:hypothetical protein MPSYJ_00570 [Mycolicibacterium psychrotolerans]